MNENAKRTRREFVRDVGLLAGSAGALAVGLCAEAADEPPDVSVAKGDDPKANTKLAIEALGGMKRFVAKGDVVVIKPNMAFERRPELATTTNPDAVVAVVELALNAGAKEVKVFDHTVMDPEKSYAESGVAEAAQKAGAKVYQVKDLEVVTLDIPDGEFLKKSSVYRDAIECDCYINLPVAKLHGLTGVSLGMKNHLGVTADNRMWQWHFGINQAICDFATAFKPKLVVIDAWRALHHANPRGGRPDWAKPHRTCIAGVNQASVDAVATSELFKGQPDKIAHLDKAAKAGVGEIDLAKIRTKRVGAESAAKG